MVVEEFKSSGIWGEFVLGKTSVFAGGKTTPECVVAAKTLIVNTSKGTGHRKAIRERGERTSTGGDSKERGYLAGPVFAIGGFQEKKVRKKSLSDRLPVKRRKKKFRQGKA